jgi:hypothetical protein
MGVRFGLWVENLDLANHSLFTFHSHFAAIRRWYYYDFITARGARLRMAIPYPVKITHG